MAIEEMIREYNIEPVRFGPNKGKVGIYRMPKAAAKKAELMKAIPEIKKYFADKDAKEKAERARRKANVDSIPGLSEIKALRADLDRWHDEFNRSFEGEGACGGLGVRDHPKGDEKALLKQYPQAAAYLRVQAEAESANYELAAIGRKALDRFEDAPQNWKKIVADMDADLERNVDEHIWD